jgi:hypothetical protein
MKSLHQSLADYNIAQLEAVAHCRGWELQTTKRTKAIDQLADKLLSPALVAIALTDLSTAETEALQFLLRHGGQIEAPRFNRECGAVRAMGSARLKREKPWQKPVSPAEGLWYKGFIFSAFQLTNQGSLEFIYIPKDLLPHLQTALDSPATEAAAQTPPIALATQPLVIIEDKNRLRENIFNLLVYLQIHPVNEQPRNKLSPKDRASLQACLSPPLLPHFSPEAELDFLLHLAKRAELLMVSHHRLRPNPNQAQTWLQNSASQQTRHLQQTWRADPTWNDLRRVPGLIPQSTGWENSPLLARSKILNHLLTLAPHNGNWYSLSGFTEAIKQTDPDFQRPGGNYDSWYIQDKQGNYLMGFAHWDEIEGGVIRYIVAGILPLLGVIELGQAAETELPDSFRLTASGADFLRNTSLEPETAPPQPLQVDDNLRVHVRPAVSLYDRFQLARFATLEKYNGDRILYRIEQDSVMQALRNGISAEQIINFLNRTTDNRTPLPVMDLLRHWEQRRSTVKIERPTLLRLKDAGLMEELRQNPELSPLLGEVIGPTAILIPPQHVREVQRILTQLGYLSP